jgi:predicted GNAT family N-acyltransferase
MRRKNGTIDSPSNRSTPKSKSSLGLSWDGLICYIAALKFQINKANWEVDWEKLYSVRCTVFVEEQKVPEEIEKDELDPVARHLLATLEDGTPIGTARWTDEGGGNIRVGRVAVLREWRRCGVGSLLMDGLLEDAKNAGFLTAHLHAQVSSIPFYSNLGFSQTDDPEFEEAGIPHRMMERKL